MAPDKVGLFDLGVAVTVGAGGTVPTRCVGLYSLVEVYRIYLHESVNLIFFIFRTEIDTKKGKAGTFLNQAVY